MEEQKQDDLYDKIVECYKELYPDIKDYIVDGFIDGVDFFDMLSEGDTIKQFRYYIDYVSVKL